MLMPTTFPVIYWDADLIFVVQVCFIHPVMDRGQAVIFVVHPVGMAHCTTSSWITISYWTNLLPLSRCLGDIKDTLQPHTACNCRPKMFGFLFPFYHTVFNSKTHFLLSPTTESATSKNTPASERCALIINTMRQVGKFMHIWSTDLCRHVDLSLWCICGDYSMGKQ